MSSSSGEGAQEEATALLAAGEASPATGLALQTIFSALKARDKATRGSDDTALLARVSGGRRWLFLAGGSILDQRWGVTPETLEQGVAYCLKIVSQSNRSSYTTSLPSSPSAGKDAQQIEGEPAFNKALVQAVSTLDRLCLEASSGDLVPRIFTPLSKLFQRVVATNPLSPQSGLLLAPLLQFFLDHGDDVMYDVEPAVHTFFRTCLVKEHIDQAVATAALHLLVENSAKLKALSSPIFPRYFPLLFKTVAWSGDSHLYEALLTLLPCMLGPTSTLCLFHAILDVPTLVLALEHADRAAKDPEKMAALMEAAFMGSAFGDSAPKVTPQSPIRRPEPRSLALEALYAELSRNENDGVLPKAWMSPETALALEKEAKRSHSQRMLLALKKAPKLLDAYVTLVIQTSDESLLTPLATFAIQKASSLFSDEAFQLKMTRICSRFLLVVFERFSSLLALLKKPILRSVSPPPTSPGQIELAVHLIWAVGEYHMGGPGEHVAARQVFETLELLLYESLAAASALNFATGVQRPSASDRPPVTSPRLLCVVITAVTKLTTVHRELASRARVCIAKIARSKQTVDPHVWRKACECFSLLQEPAICAAVFSPLQQHTALSVA